MAETINITAENSLLQEVYILKDEDLNLNQTFVISDQNNNSKIEIRAVLYGKSRFRADILLKILKGAINSNSSLSIRCLLLSSQSHANVIPSLEINEDQVKAGHAATLSYLEETELQYLKSRGLSHEQAEQLLIESFIKFT